jgi:hypothetical protein
VGATIVAPTATATEYGHHNFSFLDASPLYVAPSNPNAHEITYTDGWLWWTKNTTVTFGGGIEPFAFGGPSPSTGGLPLGVSQGVLQVMEAPERPWTLAQSIAASSWAPAAFIDSSFAESTGMSTEMFSPAYDDQAMPPTSTEFYVGDGGDMCNNHLIGMLLRGVDTVIMFWNFEDPMQGSAYWDPYSGESPTAKNIDLDIPAFFGIGFDQESYFANMSWDLTKNQVFSEHDWPDVAAQFQEAEGNGRGIVVSTTHTTVENVWWGVPPGLTVNITWVLLGRAAAWEAQLTETMHDLVVPTGTAAAQDPSQTIDAGPFERFPNYATTAASLNVERANLLADFTGWTVKEHKDVFRRAILRP